MVNKSVYLLVITLTFFVENIYANSMNEFRGFFVPLGEYDQYFKKQHKKIEGSNYWAFEQNLFLTKLSSGEEFGKTVPHLVLFSDLDKRKTVLINEKYLQSIHYTNIAIKNSVLSFEIRDTESNKLIEKCSLNLITHEDIGLTFIKSIGLEMNY